eukprot:10076814-Prorocentrum_lima.AAC.1
MHDAHDAPCHWPRCLPLHPLCQGVTPSQADDVQRGCKLTPRGRHMLEDSLNGNKKESGAVWY